jgi:predicted RNA methylase
MPSAAAVGLVPNLLGQLTGPTAPSGPRLDEEAARTIPRWHFAMLNDLERNNVYLTALERQVSPGSLVLDIGSGTGLLAMIAARANAGSVITCEANPVLAQMARSIIDQNGLSDRITVIPKRSTDLQIGVDLPRRADLIVSEIVDCGLIGEGILPTIRHARNHLLAPGGHLIPGSARLMGALVESAAVDNLNRAHTSVGFDVRLINQAATPGHFPVRLATWPHRIISAPTELVSFDFTKGSLADGRTVADIPVTASGTAHAMVAWFEMSLADGVILSNSPDNTASHWMQACLPLSTPVSITAGARARMHFSWQGERLSAEYLSTVKPNDRNHDELQAKLYQIYPGPGAAQGDRAKLRQ